MGRMAVQLFDWSGLTASPDCTVWSHVSKSSIPKGSVADTQRNVAFSCACSMRMTFRGARGLNTSLAALLFIPGTMRQSETSPAVRRRAIPRRRTRWTMRERRGRRSLRERRLKKGERESRAGRQCRYANNPQASSMKSGGAFDILPTSGPATASRGTMMYPKTAKGRRQLIVWRRRIPRPDSSIFQPTDAAIERKKSVVPEESATQRGRKLAPMR